MGDLELKVLEVFVLFVTYDAEHSETSMHESFEAACRAAALHASSWADRGVSTRIFRAVEVSSTSRPASPPVPPRAEATVIYDRDSREEEDE